MLNINNSLITQKEKIEEIRTTLLRGDRDRDLCRKKSDFPNFYELYNVLSEIKEHTEFPEHFTKCKYYVFMDFMRFSP